MFHTYVLASSGRQIDIDRAMLEMDDGLLAEAEKAWRERVKQGIDPFDQYLYETGIATGTTRWPIRPTIPSRAQYVWDHYCWLHERTHAEFFRPDVDPDWDQ